MKRKNKKINKVVSKIRWSELAFFLYKLGEYSGWGLLIIIFLYVLSGRSLLNKSFLGLKMSITMAQRFHYHSEWLLYLFLILHIAPFLIIKGYNFYRRIKKK